MIQRPQKICSRPPIEKWNIPTRYIKFQKMRWGWYPSSQNTQHEHPATPERIPIRNHHVKATIPGIKKSLTPQISNTEVQNKIITGSLKSGIYNVYCK